MPCLSKNKFLYLEVNVETKNSAAFRALLAKIDDQTCGEPWRAYLSENMLEKAFMEVLAEYNVNTQQNVFTGVFPSSIINQAIDNELLSSVKLLILSVGEEIPTSLAPFVITVQQLEESLLEGIVPKGFIVGYKKEGSSFLFKTNVHTEGVVTISLFLKSDFIIRYKDGSYTVYCDKSVKRYNYTSENSRIGHVLTEDEVVSILKQEMK